MEFRDHTPTDAAAIEDLFIAVFSDSEGETEGRLIGELVRNLIATTDGGDLYGFVAVDGEAIIGTLFFSRLTFREAIEVFLLAPVAVRTDYQGKGTGQALIHHGLRELKSRGVQAAVTYGDPAFYSRVGFEPLSQETIEAPLKLSQPEGWLGQSLTEESLAPIPGRPSCVRAFDDPAYW
jgi:predicted N-acetyltransferase YhbS